MVLSPFRLRARAAARLSEPTTAEQSNTLYGSVTPASGATVSQALVVPELLSYRDNGTPGNVSSPVGVETADGAPSHYLFGGRSLLAKAASMR